MTSDELYKKYEKIFKYIDKITYNYLKGKTIYRFKQISMDYEDVKQEVYIEIFKVLKEYEEKYKDVKKIHLAPHVKKICLGIIQNLLRDNKHKVFISIDQILQEEDADTINEKIKQDKVYKENIDRENEDKKNEEKDKKKSDMLKNYIINPLLISSTKHREKLSEDEIRKILKKCRLSNKEYRILELKIIDNYTLKKIKDTLGLKSRQTVHERLKRALKKLRCKYKTIEEVFETK